MDEGTEENPVIIKLKVIPKAKDFETNLKDGGKVIFDEKEEYFKCLERNLKKRRKAKKRRRTK